MFTRRVEAARRHVVERPALLGRGLTRLAKAGSFGTSFSAVLECSGAHLDKPMKTLIPQREHFAGPQLLSPAWTLSKGQRSAVCTIWSHEFGFEVRLVVSGDPLPRTEVCRTQEDLIARQDTWRAALEAKGWQKA